MHGFCQHKNNIVKKGIILQFQWTVMPCHLWKLGIQTFFRDINFAFEDEMKKKLIVYKVSISHNDMSRHFTRDVIFYETNVNQYLI